ncbi:MAG: ABC transporter substrate-binding protein [Synergistaceae bacterium]|jgi:branched-chain amino acid transport system substrate-binding protein|nr:ABC transporter substrate-binding protein [Synergistaceae bacterium]
MKKMTVCIALVLTFLISSAAIAAEPIKLGYLAALTGEYAPYGIAEVNASKMAVAEINEAGGVLGRPIELVVYDTKTRNEDAVNGVRRMIESDKVVTIMGANSSGINLATGPLANEGQVPQIGTATTNTLVTVDEDGNVRPYSFRICFTDPYQGTIAAEFIKNHLKKSKAAIFHNIGSDYAQGLREFFIERFKALGGEVVVDEAYRDADIDFRSQIAILKNSGAEVLFIPGIGRDIGLIFKQTREMGLADIELLCGDGYGEFLNDIAGKAMIGSYSITHTDLSDPNMAPVFKKYEETYKEEAKEFGNITLAYDLTYWVADALKRAGAAEGPAIAKALEETKGLALKHATITMDPATHNPINKPAVILKIGDDMRSHFYLKVTPE